MALYAELATDIRVYEEQGKENPKFGCYIPTKTLTDLTVESSGRVSLVAGASDVEFSFQAVANGQLIVLKSEKQFTAKLDGIGNPEITFKPHTINGVVVPGFLAMLADGVTSVHLGNPGAEAITVDVGIAGV